MSEKKKDSEKKADRRPKGELELVMTRWTALSGTAKAASLREQELGKRFSRVRIQPLPHGAANVCVFLCRY